MNNSITFVSFIGSSLATVKIKNTVYVCMKSVVSGIGLDWSTQHRKLRGSYQKYGCGFLSIPVKNGTKKILAIPLKKLSNWLQSINPKKVKDSLKDTVVIYQRECAEAIQAYWRKPRTLKKPCCPQPVAKNKSGLQPDQIAVIKALHRQLVLSVAKEKQAELAMTLWQAVQTRYGVSYEHVPASKFSEVLCLLSRVAVKKVSLGNAQTDNSGFTDIMVPPAQLDNLYESFVCSQNMRLMFEHLLPALHIFGSKYENQVHKYAYEIEHVFNNCYKAFLPLFDKMPESEIKESARKHLAKLM